MTGVYNTGEGGDTSLVPKIAVNDTHREAVVNAVSSLTS